MTVALYVTKIEMVDPKTTAVSVVIDCDLGRLQLDVAAESTVGDPNGILNRVQVVPVTTRMRHVYPSEAIVRIDGRLNKAMADQIATADKVRLRQRIGRVTRQEMKA